MKHEIRIYGDPVLRAEARSVEKIDEKIRALAQDMIETMHVSEGVGLAAQQIGLEIAICVIDVPETSDKDAEGARLNPGLAMPMIVINPEILDASKKAESHEEGCLSFPDIRANIDRSRDIRLRYLDENGQAHEIDVHGFVARVLQHEIDHLNGILFIDKMSAAKRFAIKGKLKRMKEDTEERLGGSDQ